MAIQHIARSSTFDFGDHRIFFTVDPNVANMLGGNSGIYYSQSANGPTEVFINRDVSDANLVMLEDRHAAKEPTKAPRWTPPRPAWRDDLRVWYWLCNRRSMGSPMNWNMAMRPPLWRNMSWQRSQCGTIKKARCDGHES